MELDPQAIQSPFFDEELFREQIERIRKAAAEAQKTVDYEMAHNEEILRAISVVEEFLRRKHRLCYGGQAINAHLPMKYKFYNPQYDIPDYDIFTPDQNEDIRLISKEFRRAGFTEISAREGMHEGTIKLYINFVPVLDLTQIDTRLYKILAQKELKVDGISYLDANTLRMLMYLELSRPRGEVERWGKVYERLMLLNHFAPAEPCKIGLKRNKEGLTEQEINAIMDFVVREKRVFAGADLVGFYRISVRKGKSGGANWLLRTRRPIIFYSTDLKKDIEHFRYEFRHLSPSTSVKVQKIDAMGGDFIPEMAWFLRGDIEDVPILIIVNQTACHSYYNIPLKHGETLRAATLDTLITLFFSMSLLQYKNEGIKAIECLAQELVEISYRARASPDKFPFPFVSLECTGHQKRIASLIREKVRRITANKKAKLQNLIQTRSQSQSRSQTIRKSRATN